jgi:hypothetical protein
VLLHDTPDDQALRAALRDYLARAASRGAAQAQPCNRN